MSSSADVPNEDYDPIAEEYVQQFYHELQHKPFDRELLDRFALLVLDIGPVCDLGCGPGQIARYLKDRGVDAIGVDLSVRMVEAARRLNPDTRFQQGDMRQLPAEDETWGGIVAFYSIIHIPNKEVVDILSEFYRVLREGAWLLLAFHIGEEVIHLDDWWDKPVSLDFYFFNLDEMVSYLRETDFIVDEVLERPPYKEVEHASQRGYILARKG